DADCVCDLCPHRLYWFVAAAATYLATDCGRRAGKFDSVLHHDKFCCLGFWLIVPENSYRAFSMLHGSDSFLPEYGFGRCRFHCRLVRWLFARGAISAPFARARTG